jgi:uncharacterized protein YbjQ (UPF0145 family)
MSDIKNFATHQLIDELSARYDNVVVGLHNNNNNTGEQLESTQISYSGTATTCIGLAIRIKRYLTSMKA